MSAVHRWIERHTGLVFGVHTMIHGPRKEIPTGTFYVRIGDGEQGLVPFEAGTSRRFFYLSRFPR